MGVSPRGFPASGLPSVFQASRYISLEMNSLKKPRIFADFHNADSQGRLRLNCTGTKEDLAAQNVPLHKGQALVLYSEELMVDGVVQFSEKENLWVAEIHWAGIKNRSLRKP